MHTYLKDFPILLYLYQLLTLPAEHEEFRTTDRTTKTGETYAKSRPDLLELE